MPFTHVNPLTKIKPKMLSSVFRLILFARFLYSLILVIYYNNVSQDFLENNSSLDPVSEVLEEIFGCMTAVHSICKAANDAFNGLFMAALTSDPSWNLGLRK
jgi:hypothetical protein